MFKLIIKTQNTIKNKNFGYQRGQISLYKVSGIVSSFYKKIKIFWSVKILEIDYVRLVYFKFNPLTKIKKSTYIGGKNASNKDLWYESCYVM